MNGSIFQVMEFRLVFLREKKFTRNLGDSVVKKKQQQKNKHSYKYERYLMNTNYNENDVRTRYLSRNIRGGGRLPGMNRLKMFSQLGRFVTREVAFGAFERSLESVLGPNVRPEVLLQIVEVLGRVGAAAAASPPPPLSSSSSSPSPSSSSSSSRIFTR